MIDQTKSYQIYKEQMQSMHQFSTLILHAVPVLKTSIKLGTKSKPNIPYDKPDFLKGGSSAEQLQGFGKVYKKKLGTYLLISAFSYFESYFKAVIDEFFAFHGGRKAFLDFAHKKSALFMKAQEASLKKARRTLQEYKKKHYIERYKKYSKELIKANYRFPSDIFAYYGIHALMDDLARLRSVEIPEIMQNAFLFQITAGQKEHFHSLREMRNKIAHGSAVKLDLLAIYKHMNSLKALAARFDTHLREHYFVIEEYSLDKP